MYGYIRVLVKVKLALKTSSHASAFTKASVKDPTLAMLEWCESRGIPHDQARYLYNFDSFERAGTIHTSGNIILNIHEDECPYGVHSVIAERIAYEWAEKYGVAKKEIVEIKHLWFEDNPKEWTYEC